MHSLPTARGGGFSFFISFSIFLICAPMEINLKIPLLLSSTIIFLVGYLDDIIDVSPFVKLSGQFFALIVYFFTSEFLYYKISILEGILSAIWIIFLTNATNLIDGLNGLAAGVCASQSLCLATISLILGANDILTCALILLGAIVGFLPRNFPNAKIFMGDCGALFLGFTLAILSSRLVIENKSIVCLFATLLIFRVPTYDTNISIIRRIIKGKNPFKADKEHFHHLLLRKGFSKECATFLIVTLSLLFGFLGIVLLWNWISTPVLFFDFSSQFSM